MKYKHVMMIDLETLSLRPTAFVTQCGFCVASLEEDPDRRWLVPPTNYWLSNAGQEKNHIDPNTVRWWANQSQAARDIVLNPQNVSGLNDIPIVTASALFDVLKSTYDRFSEGNEQLTVWANPSAFDFPILMNLFNGEKPWPYYQERCLMTLRREVDPDKKLRPRLATIEHDAASDAEAQALYLLNILDEMRAKNV